MRKPLVALIAGLFQEKYPAGMSFGHAAAMISAEGDSASEKRAMMKEVGVIVADSVSDLPRLLGEAGLRPCIPEEARA